MKTVLALVSLTLGMVLGFSAGMVTRAPEALFDPQALLSEDAPEACLEVVDAADELAAVAQDYLALIGETYVPALEDVVDDPVEGSVLDALLAAERRLADLSDRTASATATVNEAGVVCRSRSRE